MLSEHMAHLRGECHEPTTFRSKERTVPTPECTSAHHWHDTGVFLASNPPQREQVCCQCGAKRLLQETPPAKPPTCGPFAGGG